VKYTVKAYEVYCVDIDVEAEDEQEALANAEDILACGCYPDGTDLPKSVYDDTMDRDDWKVWER